MNKEQMLALPNWAVVGATPKKDRFGYKIWKQMQDAGYTVYGVNPGYEEIDGQKIYADLTEIPGPVDAIDMIVNPKLVPEVLKTAKELGIQNIFFQPGSYTDETLALAEEMGFSFIDGDCVYASLKRKNYLRQEGDA